MCWEVVVPHTRGDDGAPEYTRSEVAIAFSPYKDSWKIIDSSLESRQENDQFIPKIT